MFLTVYRLGTLVPRGGAKAKPVSLLRRPFDLLFVLYFFIHIPITALFDAQSIVSGSTCMYGIHVYYFIHTPITAPV
jgi:hypothetical protein